MSELAKPRQYIEHNGDTGFTVATVQETEALQWREDIRGIDPEFSAFAIAGISAINAATRVLTSDDAEKMSAVHRVSLKGQNADNDLNKAMEKHSWLMDELELRKLIQNGVALVTIAHTATDLKYMGEITEEPVFKDKIERTATLFIPEVDHGTRFPSKIGLRYVAGTPWRLQFSGDFGTETHFANVRVDSNDRDNTISIEADTGRVKDGFVGNLLDGSRFQNLDYFADAVDIYKRRTQKP
jgi:hypothetical protein